MSVDDDALRRRRMDEDGEQQRLVRAVEIQYNKRINEITKELERRDLRAANNEVCKLCVVQRGAFDAAC